MPKEFSIVIDVPARTLHLQKTNRKFRSYPVAVGKPSTPTPRGTFTIVDKLTYPGEIYGTRLLALSKPYYSIHGTNAPELIGQAVSNGCVRMYNHHVEELFPLVDIGTIVRIPDHAEYWHQPAPPKEKRTGSSTAIYYVRPGDTLWSIATQLRTTVSHLLKLNPHIRNPDLLYPGQEIIIPG
ncbi:MAG: L,D-transpeptidase family protein [bacterium]|jgi:hypothetical protein